MGKYSDVNRLVSEAKQNNEVAYEKLLNLISPILRFYAFKYSSMCNKLEYDDAYAISEVALIEAVKAFDFNANTSFINYLKLKVRQKLSHEIAWYSAKRRDSSREIPLTPELAVDTGFDYDDEILRSDIMGRALQIARELLNDYEYTIYLRYISGEKPHKIKKDMNLNPSTRIDSIIFRANKKIIKRLRDEFRLE